MFTTLATIVAEGNGYWLPHDKLEVIWGSIAFFIVVGLLWKFAVPSIKQAMEDRTTQIGDDLGAAESMRKGSETERDEIKAALADSDTEAARIIEEARQTADALSREIRERADREVIEVGERSVSDIDVATRQAMADMHSEVSRLASGAAEQVVHSNLDDSAQQRLIDDYISRVGANN